MQTKRLLGRIEIKDAARGEVEAVFATLDVIDADGDVTVGGAFEDGAAVRISAYGHRSWEGALPVGRGTIRTNSREAILDGRFFLDSQPARDTFAVVKEMGDLQEWSYGYDVLDSAPGKFGGQNVRLLRKLRVHEISPVMLAAGVGTRTLAVKGAEENDRAELLRIRDRILAWSAHEDFIRASAKAEYERFRSFDAFVSESRSAGARYCYRSCSAPPAVALLAGKLAQTCAAELSIPPPAEIKFFADAGKGADEPSDGFTWPVPVDGLADREKRRIWLRAGMTVDRLMETVAHETRHLGVGGDETTAGLYGRRFSMEGV